MRRNSVSACAISTVFRRGTMMKEYLAYETDRHDHTKAPKQTPMARRAHCKSPGENRVRLLPPRTNHQHQHGKPRTTKERVNPRTISRILVRRGIIESEKRAKTEWRHFEWGRPNRLIQGGPDDVQRHPPPHHGR